MGNVNDPKMVTLLDLRELVSEISVSKDTRGITHLVLNPYTFAKLGSPKVVEIEEGAGVLVDIDLGLKPNQARAVHRESN